MLQLNTSYISKQSLRVLLIRLNSDDIRKVISIKIGDNDCDNYGVENIVSALMKLKHKEFNAIDENEFFGLKAFLQRLDMKTAKEIFARQWAGESLSHEKIDMYYTNLVLLYFDVFAFEAKNKKQ